MTCALGQTRIRNLVTHLVAKVTQAISLLLLFVGWLVLLGRVAAGPSWRQIFAMTFEGRVFVGVGWLSIVVCTCTASKWVLTVRVVRIGVYLWIIILIWWKFTFWWSRIPLWVGVAICTIGLHLPLRSWPLSWQRSLCMSPTRIIRGASPQRSSFTCRSTRFGRQIGRPVGSALIFLVILRIPLVLFIPLFDIFFVLFDFDIVGQLIEVICHSIEYLFVLAHQLLLFAGLCRILGAEEIWLFGDRFGQKERINRLDWQILCGFGTIMRILLNKVFWINVSIKWDPQALVDLLHGRRFFELVYLISLLANRFFDVSVKILNCQILIESLLNLALPTAYCLWLWVNKATKTDLRTETFNLVWALDMQGVVQVCSLFLNKFILIDVINFEIVGMGSAESQSAIFCAETLAFVLSFWAHDPTRLTSRLLGSTSILVGLRDWLNNEIIWWWLRLTRQSAFE